MTTGRFGPIPALSVEVFGAVGARQAIGLARELGYDAAGLPAWRRDFDPRSLGESGARDLAAFLAKNGLAVSWLSAGPKGRFGVSATLNEDIERCMAIIALAGRVKAGAVVATLAPLGDKATAAAANAREAIGVLAQAADGAGTALALAAAQGEERLAEELLSELGDAPVGMVLDPGVTLFAGRDPVEAAMAAAKPAAVRASDSSGEETSLAPGEGRVRWRDFLATLSSRGYYGYVTVEFAARGNDAARAAKALALLRL